MVPAMRLLSIFSKQLKYKAHNFISYLLMFSFCTATSFTYATSVSENSNQVTDKDYFVTI